MNIILFVADMAHVRVAQLDRASGYGPEGRGFESCHAHFYKAITSFDVIAFLLPEKGHGNWNLLK